MKKLAIYAGAFLTVLFVSGISYVWYRHWIPREYVFTSSEVKSAFEYMKTKREYWSPASRDIAEVREKLYQYLELNDVPNEDRMYPIESYNYQFYGYVHNGKKLLNITAFCTGLESFAHYHDMGISIDKPVKIFDGGPCFFDATYDVVTKELLEVFVH